MDAAALAYWRARLAALRPVACGLAHETVRMDAGVPLRRGQGAGLDALLVRRGLCGKDVRNAQPACAHTLARHALLDAIDAMRAGALLGQAEALALAAGVRAADQAIHAIDVRKSAAELDLAALSEQQAAGLPGTAPALPAIRRELAQLVARHGEQADTLAAVLARLRRVLAIALPEHGGARPTTRKENP